MRYARFIIAIPIIAYLIYASIRDDSNYERNKQPKENVRHARGVVRMWSAGVSAKHIPNTRPAAAEALLLKTIESDADESVKQEARAVLKTLNAYPHFVRFANGIEKFTGDFERLRNVIEKASPSGNRQHMQGDRKIQPQCLVVVARKHESHRPGPDEDRLFFDAEMNNALGDTLATSPAKLKTLIVLYFSRAAVGEYRFQHESRRRGAASPFGRTGMAAYSHACRALVIDLATDSVVNVRRFTKADPEKRTVVLLGKGKQSKDGYALLREQVRNWIHKASSSVR